MPVIAKADTLTLKERERLKKRVSVSREWGREMWGSVGVFKQYVVLVVF